MADLATFIDARHEPTGPVETFSTDRSADTVAREIATEDVGDDPAALRQRRPWRRRASRRSAPGRKNSLQYEIDGSAGAAAWDSEQPDQPVARATATGRTRSCSATRR